MGFNISSSNETILSFNIGTNNTYCFILNNTINTVVNNNYAVTNTQRFLIDQASNDIFNTNTAINNDFGFSIISISSNNFVTNNTITNNNYGLVVVSLGSQNQVGNIILGNTFNNNFKSNAVDNSTDLNLWSGNYFDDYSGIGSYLIPGTANNMDLSPKMIPTTQAIVVTQVIQNNSIKWTATDPNPSTYEIFLNGTLEQSGSWISGKTITFQTNSLGVGTYNVTIVLINTLGTHISHSLIFTISNPINPITVTITQSTTSVITTTEANSSSSSSSSSSSHSSNKNSPGETVNITVFTLFFISFILIISKRKRN